MTYKLETGLKWKITESRKYFQTLETDFGRLAAGGFYKTCDRDQAIVDTLINGFAPAGLPRSCSTKVRREAQEIYADYMIHFRRAMRKQGYTFYTFTIIDGRYYTGATNTFIDLNAQQASARKLLGKIEVVAEIRTGC